jgi:hypothetical protein
MSEERHESGESAPGGPVEEDRRREQECVDEMGEESFPASDPPSTWAGEGEED